MISALYRVIVPSSSAAAVPGSRVPQGLGQVDQVPGPAAGLAQRVRDLVGGELGVRRGGVAAGQLRRDGELAAGGVGLDPVPRAQHPDQLGLRHPGEPAVLARGGVSGDRQAAQPGSTSSGIPGPNPAAGLDDSPGKTRAEPGWPGPRRPVAAASTASSSSSAASRISASSSGVSGSKSPNSSGPGGSSWSQTRSSPASSSAAVIGSGRDQAGSSSHSGSAGTGSGGMYHHPFGMIISIEYDSEK